MKIAFLLLIFSFIFCVQPCISQPYLDLLNVRASNSPNAGFINQNKENITLSYYNISATLPLVFKNKKDAVIISPFFEKWRFKLETNKDAHLYYGLALPVSYLKTINKKYSILFTGIVRMNDSSAGLTMKKQIGGAIIFNCKKNANLTLKFGAYANREYFGIFIVPLLGIHWRINTKDCIFGVLPGNFTYQHLLSSKMAYGITFRAQTNSYYRQSGKYMRIDENQMGGFVDRYLSKNIVLNAEIGHSVFRKLRTDKTHLCRTGYCSQKYHDYNVKDNIYFKVSMAYRIHL